MLYGAPHSSMEVSLGCRYSYQRTADARRCFKRIPIYCIYTRRPTHAVHVVLVILQFRWIKEFRYNCILCAQYMYILHKICVQEKNTHTVMSVRTFNNDFFVFFNREGGLVKCHELPAGSEEEPDENGYRCFLRVTECISLRCLS